MLTYVVVTNSNSWNTAVDQYTIEALEVDEYTYDHQDLLVLFSAGNNGNAGFSTIGTPTSAKNIMSIGTLSVVHQFICRCWFDLLSWLGVLRSS